jgi:hypothetical protein
VTRQTAQTRRRKSTVTRTEWQTRGSPSLLLSLMQRCGASERKLRLVFSAFCDHHRDHERLTDPELRLIAAMQQAAENPLERGALEGAIADAQANADRATSPRNRDYASGYRIRRLVEFATLQFPLSGIHPVLDLDLACALIRDVFNPFAPTDLASFWNRPVLRSLALPIYAEQAFDRLPILADALEEVGCTSKDVLDHCRSDGVHVRGCWVVDLLLGKE